MTARICQHSIYWWYFCHLEHVHERLTPNISIYVPDSRRYQIYGRWNGIIYRNGSCTVPCRWSFNSQSSSVGCLFEHSFSTHKYLTIYIRHCVQLCTCHTNTRFCSRFLSFSLRDFPAQQTIGKLSTKQTRPKFKNHNTKRHFKVIFMDGGFCVFFCCSLVRRFSAFS